jgi:glycosyltransferase involved in cell wall biosynthesis
MFGWEFPPFFAGGVGVVCHELVQQLTKKGVLVDYVMPHAPKISDWSNLRMIDASDEISEQEAQETQMNLSVTQVPSLLAAYQTPEEYAQTLKSIQSQSQSGIIQQTPQKDKTGSLYGENLLDEIDMFSKRVARMSQKGQFTDFDVIHAHDWTTVPAATAVKRITGKPMLVHVHITEFNKTAGKGVNPQVYDIERQGFYAADKILAVSNAIKETLIQEYGVPSEKIDVVHNANVAMDPVQFDGKEFKDGHQVVSFLGRVTIQKGPLHFVEMAAKVLAKRPKTKFIIGGTGDLLQECIDRTKELGIYDKFYFHGFYTRKDANFFYDISDVFVLPSLMEPFGVTPLEAMCKKTPTIVTKQSGVAEIIDHCYKVDFWDVDKMSSLVISLLAYPKLHKKMSENGFDQATKITWEKPADLCVQAYERVIRV